MGMIDIGIVAMLYTIGENNMCGIIGIAGSGKISYQLYDALTTIQHRGQNSAGISTMKKRTITTVKAAGLVRDVFDESDIKSLKGNIGIGHVRYPTKGSTTASNMCQPLYVNSPFGLTIAHNGNLTNTEELKKELFDTDRRHINTDSDSEVLLNVLAHALTKSSADADSFSPYMLFDAIEDLYERCRGGFAVVGMVAGKGMFAFRDLNGIRPLCVGSRFVDGRNEYMVASESVALDCSGFELMHEIPPGKGVFIDNDGGYYEQVCTSMPCKRMPCIFEYAYFARPDSTIDGTSVYKTRLRMGENLAKKILNEWPDHDIDVVMPIPDTSRTSAAEFAHNLGVKHREGFIKNRYIGRTFIMDNQELRQKSVRRKLNAIPLEFKDKNVLLLDDSIVRGTTSREIVQMARDAGAKNVYFASASPPVRYKNVYGIDMPTEEELVAHGRSISQIAEYIGADRLFYQDYEDFVDAVNHKESRADGFEASCFTGEYIDD